MAKKVIREYLFGIIFIICAILIIIELNTNLFSEDKSSNSNGFIIEQEGEINTDSLNSGQNEYDETISDFDRQEF